MSFKSHSAPSPKANASPRLVQSQPEPRPSLADLDAAIAQKRKEAREALRDPKAPKEIGGPEGPEPTRYGDWEVGGRCSDF